MAHSKTSTSTRDPLIVGKGTTQRMGNATLEVPSILRSCFQDVSSSTRPTKHKRRHDESKRGWFQGEARTKHSMSIIRIYDGKNVRTSDDKSCMAEHRISYAKSLVFRTSQSYLVQNHYQPSNYQEPSTTRRTTGPLTIKAVWLNTK